jgi:hypothetical protein
MGRGVQAFVEDISESCRKKYPLADRDSAGIER